MAAVTTQATPSQARGVRISPSTTIPATAATAGSRPTNALTVRARTRRNAVNSSEYGKTAVSIATASPASSTGGRSNSPPFWAIPAGAHNAVAQPSASASAPSPVPPSADRLLSSR